MVVGSGFGGAVTALRLVEKGYSVAVLEAGRRYADGEFPRTSWRLPRFLWAPRLGWYGIQRIDLLRSAGRRAGGRGAGVLVLSGAGVGGGSLVYANTLYEPLPEFYADPQWRDITDWCAELAPHYDRAKRTLGVTTYPVETEADRAMRAVAERMGLGHTVHRAPVGAHIGRGEVVPDPYFGGAGPERAGWPSSAPPCRARTPAGAVSTSPAASPSPVPSTPTRRPTSSRSGTGAAPTRWACSSPRSPTAGRTGSCGGSAPSPGAR